MEYGILLVTNRNRKGENVKYCRSCGTSIPDHGKFCPKCGKAVEEVPPKQAIEYQYFFCSKCRQKLRVPKGKGKIEITCPVCRNQFIVMD